MTGAVGIAGDKKAVRRSPVRSKAPVTALVTVVGLIPLAALLWDAGRGDLGVEPIQTITHRTGWWGLTLLVATLSVTPLRRITGYNRLIQARKPFGLLAFLYVALHLLTYVVLDQWFGFTYILEDIVERPFITVGFTAFVLLIPLALTSTKRAIRKLGGARWNQIHQLIYPAAILAVLHFLWLVKADTREPLLFGSVLIVLFILRIPAVSNALRRR